MEISYLEVVDGDRLFGDFVLDFLDDDVLAVYENEDIAGTKVDSVRPTLFGNVERVGWGGDNLFSIDPDVDEVVGFANVGFVTIINLLAWKD